MNSCSRCKRRRKVLHKREGAVYCASCLKVHNRILTGAPVPKREVVKDGVV